MKLFGKKSGLKSTAREMSAVSEYLWHKGWAEKNAGNMSVLVTDRIKQSLDPADGKRCLLNIAYPGLEGHYILLSGTGSRMRDLAKKAKKNTCLIY